MHQQSVESFSLFSFPIITVKMQVRWKTASTFLHVAHALWCFNNIVIAGGDKTTCRSSIETGDGLHFICFCDSDLLEPVTSNKAHLTVDLKLDADGKNDFSLAKFAYNLSGAYFRKKIHITFQYCRSLTILLDQNELYRIGSDYFRPDIQVSSCFIEHVYHLELLPGTNLLLENNKIKERGSSKLDPVQEYTPSLINAKIDLTVYSVALVKVHAATNFTSLVTSTPESTLYIDISDGMGNHGTNLDAKGFLKENIYFIDRKKLKIPLKEVRIQC